LARNVARGQRRARIEERKWCGNPPLGYTRDENLQLVPGDTSEIALVRRIFSMRAEQGMGLPAIAKLLNLEGIATPKGNKWEPTGVKRVLERDAYIGRLAVGKHSCGKGDKPHLAKFCPVVEEPVVIEDAHEPIIDRATWDRGQAMGREVRKAHTRNGSEGARLGGLVRCGCCGSPMHARKYIWRKAGKETLYRYYSCASYNTTGTCGFCNLSQADVERAVFAKIRDKLLLSSREKLEAAIQRVLDRRSKSEPSLDGGLLAKLEHQISRATERLLLIDDDLLPGAQRKLRELKAQRDAVAASVTREARRGPLPSAREIATSAWQLDEIMREAAPSAVRHALSQVIDHVRLDFEEHNSTPKRRRYRCTGGEIILRSAEGLRPSEPSIAKGQF
jgi:site-specific DNA recombinase